MTRSWSGCGGRVGIECNRCFHTMRAPLRRFMVNSVDSYDVALAKCRWPASSPNKGNVVVFATASKVRHARQCTRAPASRVLSSIRWSAWQAASGA